MSTVALTADLGRPEAPSVDGPAEPFQREEVVDLDSVPIVLVGDRLDVRAHGCERDEGQGRSRHEVEGDQQPVLDPSIGVSIPDLDQRVGLEGEG